MIYRFGVFEVDSRTGEIRKHGSLLRVRGRPVDILLQLVVAPGDVVTRDELRNRLWPADTFVDFDHGLHSAVNRLRDALGDSADSPRFIETLPRRGYRFIAPVTAVAVEPAAAAPPAAPAAVVAASPESVAHVEAPTPPVRRAWPGSRATLVAAVAIVAAAVTLPWIWSRTQPGSQRMTIAVVPFANLGDDPGEDFLSDGFTGELISELGMIGPDRLTVIGRTTSMLYKDAKKTIGEIGRELGVMYVLEGSVRRSGPRMRITAQLVETRNMTTLWTQSYDRDVGDVLTVQRDVANQIARSLEMAFAPAAAGRAAAEPASFAAYESYMRGLFFREQATEEGARRAIGYYEQAIAADPNYAAAYAGIADAYRLLGAPGWEVEPPTVLLPKAKLAAERALVLDPQSPQARAVLAMVKFNYDWDLPGAEGEIQEALRLNPSFAQAHQYYSSILTAMNRPDDAIAAARRAAQLDPLSPTATTTLGIRYYYAKRPDEAIPHFLKTLEVTPGFAVAHWGLAKSSRLLGRQEDHIAELENAARLSGRSAYMRAHLAYGYAVSSDRARAEALRAEIEAERGDRYVAPYHLALIAAGLADTPTALGWLERAYDDRSGWMAFLAVEPELEPLRGTPEMQRLLARVRAPRQQ